MKDFKAENTGNRIVINPASFAEARKLKDVLISQLKKYPIGLKLSGGSTDFINKDIDFTAVIDFLKNILVEIDTSEELNNALWACLKHCTYQTTHVIDENLFDTVPEARADYYEIMISCIEENLSPFIKSLVSKWKTLAPKLGENQLLGAIFQEVKA